MTLQHVNFRRRQHECIVFDGASESLTIGDVSELNFERTDTFSLVCWYRTSSAGFRCFMSKGFAFGGAGNGRGWEFSVLSGRLHTRIDHDDVTNGITKESSSAGFNDGAWHQAVLTYAGTSLAAGVLMYDNGAAIGMNTIANTLTGTIQNTHAFEIGSQDSGGFFIGHLDEVAVYDIVLSAANVTELYNGGTVVDYTTLSTAGNLVGYWRMAEESTFPTIPDLASGNDATMLNMQHFGPTRSRVLRPA